jgi:hypothetical protein
MLECSKPVELVTPAEIQSELRAVTQSGPVNHRAEGGPVRQRDPNFDECSDRDQLDASARRGENAVGRGDEPGKDQGLTVEHVRRLTRLVPIH